MSLESVGLSMYHISPQEKQKYPERVYKPEVKIWRGASLISCKLGDLQGGKGRTHDWKRGDIKKFSKGSRRRALRQVAKLKRSEVPVFVTLTYPDIFPENPRLWKNHLDSFFKRLLRRYPRAVAFWRLDEIERKSGENKGKKAPHYHLLIYGAAYLSLLPWVSRSWYEVVGSGDLDHLKAGTRVEPVRSVNGVLFYTAKYICKQDNDLLEGSGRVWGIVGRAELPGIQGKIEIIELDRKSALTVLRYMRHKGSEIYKKGRYVGRRKNPKWGIKYTLIGDSEFWYSKLPYIQ